MADIVEGDLAFVVLDENNHPVETCEVGPFYFLAFRVDSTPSPVLFGVTAVLTALGGFILALAMAGETPVDPTPGQGDTVVMGDIDSPNGNELTGVLLLGGSFSSAGVKSLSVLWDATNSAAIAQPASVTVTGGAPAAVTFLSSLPTIPTIA